MTYDLDTFVNVTAKNGRLVDFGAESDEYSDEDLYEYFPSQFAKQFVYDTVNTQADPVFVYERDGQPVAFYDCELLCGRIVEMSGV